MALRDFLVANHGVHTRECGNKLGVTIQFMRLGVRPGRDVDRLIDGMLDDGRQFRTRCAYDEDPLDNRRSWTDEAPDNLIRYPAHRRTEYTGRRAASM